MTTDGPNQLPRPGPMVRGTRRRRDGRRRLGFRGRSQTWLLRETHHFVLPLTVIVGVAILGLALWWPPSGAGDRASELGAALVSGAVVAGGILWLEQRTTRRAARQRRRFDLSLLPSLEGVDLRHADLPDANLAHKSLRRACLAGANLRFTNLMQTDLHGADLRDVDLRDLLAMGANLSEAVLYRARLGRSDFSFCDFRGADLAAADLREADLEGALLDGCRASNTTRWPKGFDPTVFGVLIEEDRS